MTFRNEQWKDGWLWVQTTPDGKWDTALATEVISALIERVAKLERPAPAQPAAFEPEDFAHAAKLLRSNVRYNPSALNAVCLNNIDIILSALDKASEDLM